MENLLDQKIAKMQNEKLDFLPIEDVLELGLEIDCSMKYIAQIEEVEDGYGCDLDFILSSLDETIGIYNNDSEIIIDGHIISIKRKTDDFERVIYPAPTLNDLLKLKKIK